MKQMIRMQDDYACDLLKISPTDVVNNFKYLFICFYIIENSLVRVRLKLKYYQRPFNGL